MQTISEKGIAFAMTRESFRPKSYLDSGGVPTVSYGSTGPDIHIGMTVTEAWASARFRRDMSAAAACVNAHVTVPLTQGEFDALGDFVYNAGQHAFSESTLLRLLNARDYAGAGAEFQRWDKCGGRVLAGLADRRKSEAEMLEGGMYV